MKPLKRLKTGEKYGIIEYKGKLRRILELKSMTGYGSSTAENDGRELTVELKSVNHRFLDINLHMPRSLNFAEDFFRKEIGKYIARGHVEVNVTYRNTRNDSGEVTVDTALVQKYREAFETIASFGFENDIKVSDVARLPDVLTLTKCDEDREAVTNLAAKALFEAAQALNATRSTEGEKIGADLKNKLTNIKSIADEIKAKSEGNTALFAQKLKKRLEDLLEDSRIDEQRLHTEVAIYADKIAIDEELVRLDTHIKNMWEYMDSEESVGRKLDFFIQELNREVNTVGSKSVDADIAKLVVSAKGEIEKLREQIQNIE